MDRASRIIGQLDGDSDLAKVIDREGIACKAWKKAVGERLAKRTRAVKLVRDRLVVQVEDEMWRENLWGLRYQILSKLRGVLGPGVVTAVNFVVMPPRREPQRAAKALPLLDAYNGAHDDEAAGIEDPVLRRNYRRARARESA
jgi:hypothetical protein